MINWDKPLRLVNNSNWKVVEVEKLNNHGKMHLVTIERAGDYYERRRIAVNSDTGNPPDCDVDKSSLWFLENVPDEKWIITAKFEKEFSSWDEAQHYANTNLVEDAWTYECVRK